MISRRSLLSALSALPFVGALVLASCVTERPAPAPDPALGLLCGACWEEFAVLLDTNERVTLEGHEAHP